MTHINLLTEQLRLANEAIQAQFRIIQHDGSNFAYVICLKQIINERNVIEGQLQSRLIKCQTV